MCNNTESNDCKCISEILTVIAILQKNAACPESCLDTCDRGFLGCSVSTVGCNTRPIMLYTCCGNGAPWSMPTVKDDVVCGDEGVTCSNVFRVEKIDGCCATFRVLAPNPDTTQVTTIPYEATNSFFTMNLNCVCSLRCLQDTFVDVI
jgi:spore coat protein Z